MRLAIVLPVLDEETAIVGCLTHAGSQADDVVVVDGGSRDRTRELAAGHGARVLLTPPGRGGQIRAGIAATDAEAILVLHADTILPPGAGDAIRAALASGAAGGGFLLRFDDPAPIYRFGGWMVGQRTRLSRAPLGDQAQFFTRAAHDRIGGFRDWPLLEDLDFIRRLRAAGRLVVLPLAVITSARRYQRRGPVRNLATNWAIWTLFALGVPPERLARWYRHIR